MSRLLRSLKLPYLNRMCLFNTRSYNAFNVYSTERCVHNSIYSSLCVEIMPMLGRSIHHAETAFFKTKQERLDNISRLGFHELGNLNIRNYPGGINMRHTLEKLSLFQDKRLEVSESDLSLTPKTLSNEYSKFLTNTTSYNSFTNYPVYLLTKPFKSSEDWGFPCRLLLNSQSLFDSAQKEILHYFNIQVAILSEFPQSYINYRLDDSSNTSERLRFQIFFMKATVIGKAIGTILNHEQFRWCSKEEIKLLVTPEYYSAISHMLFY